MAPVDLPSRDRHTVSDHYFSLNRSSELRIDAGAGGGRVCKSIAV